MALRRGFMALHRILLVFYVCLLALGCSPKQQESAVITGEAYFRERMLVPAGSQLEVFLEDVSLAYTPTKLLGNTLIPNAGQPPYHFEVRYQPNQIMPGHTFNLRARLTLGKQLLFTTVQAYPVLSTATGNNRLLLVRAKHSPGPSLNQSASLAGSSWQLRQLDEQLVAQNKQTAQINFDANNYLNGSDGCNRMTGQYIQAGDNLSFSHLASTRMACLDNAKLAEVFSNRLGKVSRFQILDGQLRLLDSEDKILLRLNAVPVTE